MLHNVYIFRNDGICLFTRKYGSIEIDESLVSGFLSAISHFGSKIGTKSLERLDFGDYRIILVGSEEDLITAGVIDKDDDVNEVEKSLKSLIYDFKTHYGQITDTIVDDQSLFIGYAKRADEILHHVSSPKKIIEHTTNLTHVIKQMKNNFTIILEVIASGKPLIVCSESREDAELYTHTLAKFRPQIAIIPWTEDEKLIFSLKERTNIIVGVPLRYVMKLAGDDELSIINLAFFRIHSAVHPAKYWKDTAKHAQKHIEELGNEVIYRYIQSRMESLKETSS